MVTTGRPRVDGAETSTQVTTTLPDLVVEEVDDYVDRDGTTRSAELRLLVIQGLASRRAAEQATTTRADRAESAADRQMRQERQPAVDLLASWISNGGDESRARFLRYRAAASDAGRLIGCLLGATRDQLDAGLLTADSAVKSDLIARLGNKADWRFRGQLFFEVVAEMGRRGVALTPAAPGEPDDDEPEPDSGQRESELDEDYA